jgi:hypothetical protein
MSGREWNKVYAGVALSTLATLLLELSLTRIFSVVFYYHFAFLAISIALFGLGAGGVFSYIVAGWKGPVYRKLAWLAMANSLLVIGALVFLLSTQGTPNNLRLALVYATTAMPFFVSGAIVSLAISENISRVDRVYFFDLMGAAAGCLLLIPMLDWLGGPNTVMAAGLAFALSSIVWANLSSSRALTAAAAVLSIAMVLTINANNNHPFIDIAYAKGQKLEPEEFVQWNSFSRIGVTQEPDSKRRIIVIDADASTGIANFDLEHLTEAQRRFLFMQGPGFPYALRPGAKTLVIGPGGGWDISRALASGSKDVTGVEINPIIASTIMRDEMPQWSRNLYLRPEVKIHVEDGRSYVRRSKEKFQVIQATLVDTWASTAAGAFALSENNLYTSDAFSDYLAHLTDDGMMAFTRWGYVPPRESLRLVSLAIDALLELGETRPYLHVIVVRDNLKDLNAYGALDTVLIARKPFTADDVSRAREILARSGREAVYLPGDKDGNEFTKLLRSPDPEEFERSYAFDISPVDDDRPFFFYTVQPRDLFRFINRTSAANADAKISSAVPLLFGVVGLSIAATLIILALPPMLLGARLPAGRGVRRFLLYFFSIGVGYILIQVALIQKFVLFLGHPTYALTVIIFSMLVASGAGSYFSSRILRQSERRLMYALGGVAVLVSLLAFAAAPLTTSLVGLPLPAKIILTAALIAPAAFLMGMPFPSGLARLEKLHKHAVRWAWSLNAAASVLGSAGAIFLAIFLGLRITLLIGGLMYLCALAALKLDARVSGENAG